MSLRRWVIRGRVQGVGFRWFVMREAERLKLGGYVEMLEQHLRRGPSHARVDDVARLQVPSEVEIPRSFDIR